MDVNDLSSDGAAKDDRERKEITSLATDALVILWRVKLRFNPGSNKDKEQDDRFLKTLDALVDPGKVPPTGTPSSKKDGWDQLATDAVGQAQEILKRKWEVTKHPNIRFNKLLHAGGLFVAMVGTLFILTYRLPQPIIQHPDPVAGERTTSLQAEKPNSQNIYGFEGAADGYRFLSDVGPILILVGFFCQLVGVLRPRD